MSIIEHNRLFNKDFIVLSAIMFVAYCNLAAFFQFHEYLSTLPVPTDAFGLLIALFSLSVLILRPVVSVFLNPTNANRWILISSSLVIACLFSYNLAQTFWPMAIVRVFHGAAHAVLATAVLSRIVGCIPVENSGQAFGLLSVVTLMPYAVIPPLMAPLCQRVGSFGHVLDISAIAMAPVIPLMFFLDKPSAAGSDVSSQRINLSDLFQNLQDYRVLLFLLLTLIMWTTISSVFFFVQSYGSKIGITNPGWFFTLSGFMEILVRITTGHLFDRIDKPRLLAFSFVWLALGYSGMVYAFNPTAFFGIGILLGLGWGVAVPVLSAALFDISLPQFRALNANLSMEMYQAGFFVGPLIGGAILFHWGYGPLYFGCGLLSVVGLFAIVPTLGARRQLGV
jgi:predicted MFS family arabinose efflux permease